MSPSDAVFSPCGLYRVRLDRQIDMLGGITVAFCLHNPSRANADADDATSRRGLGFAQAWGASHLIFVNPWAGIATQPADLWAMDDPVGPDNDAHIAQAAREAHASGGFMVVSWGRIHPPAERRADAHARLRHVEALIRATGCGVRALGINSDGSPKHPLYLDGAALPLAWPETWSAAA